MSRSERRAAICHVVQRVCALGQLAALDDLCAGGIVCHRPPLPRIRGVAALKEYVADMRSAFSDIRLTIDRIILDEDAHALLWTLKATHTGSSPVLPIPPTFREVVVTGCTMGAWADGEIVEQWSHIDWLGLFRQLGVVPPMG